MRSNYLRILILMSIILLFALAGCGGDEDTTGNTADATPDTSPPDSADSAPMQDSSGDTETESPDGNETNRARFVTFNAGLAVNFVRYAKQRVEPVGQLLSDSPADVICGQEIWTFENDEGKTQVDRIVDQTSEAFPHNHYKVTQVGASGKQCTQEELGPLKQCIDENCPDASGNDLTSCATNNCAGKLGGLSSSCTSCLSSNLDKSLEEIEQLCTTEGGSNFTSGGHNGLLVLSKHPFESAEFKGFESAVVKRGALHVTVKTPKKTDVYCTHLAADLSDQIEYPGDEYDSYKAEQAGQIDALLDWIDETANTDRIVIMGDMNSGPQIGQLEAAFPDNYAKFIDAGYKNPYLSSESPACTVCPDNTLTDSGPPTAIDHVLSSEPLKAVDSERVFDDTIQLETDEGTETVHPSDHFGVSTVLEF